MTPSRLSSKEVVKTSPISFTVPIFNDMVPLQMPTKRIPTYSDFYLPNIINSGLIQIMYATAKMTASDGKPSCYCCDGIILPRPMLLIDRL